MLARSKRYAADHVTHIEVVTADGELRQVIAGREPDLFWALRGGKGNLGVVTAIEFELLPVAEFYDGGLRPLRLPGYGQRGRTAAGPNP